MNLGQKNTENYVFELKPDIFEIGGKWSVRNLFSWTKEWDYVDYFRL